MAEFIRTGALIWQLFHVQFQKGMMQILLLSDTLSSLSGYGSFKKICTGQEYLMNYSNQQENLILRCTLQFIQPAREIFIQINQLTHQMTLKGMIVRVNDSPTYLSMVKYMGGVGTAMSQSEVYTALQQGSY